MFIEISELGRQIDFYIAIFIARTRFGNHTGILTKEGGTIKLFHLAWHQRLACDSIEAVSSSPNYLLKRWVKFTSLVDDEVVAAIRNPTIIKWLELLFSKNANNIPYGFNFRETKFTSNAELALGPGEIGLTCATFVASFFESMGYSLVDLNTWISRAAEDQEWKAKVIDAMNRTGVPFEHIAVVSDEPVNFRLKPEEIAVASSKPEEDLPADFQFCASNGAEFNRLEADTV
jgi:hypothetical protein